MARWGILAKLVMLMAISLTHTTVAVGTDAGNGEIRKAQWNEQHTLALDTLRLVGRTTATTGPAEEISVGSNLSLSSLTLDLAASPSITGDLTVADRIVHAADTNTAIRFPADDTFTVETSGSERVRVASNGRVGIGTTSPAARLDVVGDIKVGDGATIYSNTNITISADPGNTSAASVVNILVDNLEVADFNNVGYLRFNKTAFAGAGVCTQQSDNVLHICGGANAINDGVNFALSGPSHVSGTAGFLFRDSAVTKHGWNRAGDYFFWNTGGSERVRINSAGNVGIGTAIPVGKFNVTGGTLGTTAGDEVNVSTFTVPEGGFNLNLSAKAIRHTTGSGYLNTEFRISSDVDQNATKNAWLSFYSDSATLADNIIRFGEAASTEWMRIDNGNVGIGTASPVTPLDVNGAVISRGVVYLNQPAQTSKAAAATLTIAELLTGIIQYTGAADTLTLPTGTLIEGGVPATFPTNMSFDFSVINTGSGTVTLGTAASLTLTGTMTVAAGSSGLLRVRKTATNTYTVYRIS